MGLQSWLKRKLVDFLTKPVSHYERHGHNDLTALKRHARKGDVLLVEGEQRISQIIKYLTQSTWSHSVLYIGDELVQRGGALADQAVAMYGDEADSLVVEALMDGVVASPVSKYVDFNLRLCRPYGLRPDALKTLIDDAIGTIGWQYDLRNALDIAAYFVTVSLFRSRYERKARRFGSKAETEVICSSLLGLLYQKVKFPVAPIVTFPDGDHQVTQETPHGLWKVLSRRRIEPPGLYRTRHPTVLTPRDFDISPYFDIIKFNTLADRDFDYTRIRWAEHPELTPEIAAEIESEED